MTTAERILSIPDRTMRERRDMCEIRTESFTWHGQDIMYQFADGSGIIATLDCDLAPIGMVIV
jgi:hypothetical protein